MWIEQEQGNLRGIKAGGFRNGRKRRRLIGRWARLGCCDNVASLAPAVGDAETIAGIGSNSRAAHCDRSCYETPTGGISFAAPVHLGHLLERFSGQDQAGKPAHF
jgi:hypothetical protein